MQLSTEQVDRFKSQGFIIIRAVFSTQDIKTISKHLDDLASHAFEFDPLQTGVSFHDYKGTQVILSKNKQGKSRIDRIDWVSAAKPDLLEYARSPEILEPVSQLLSSTEADHLINQVHYKYPGDGVHFGWHQDSQNRHAFCPGWLDINGEDSYVVAIVAIDENMLENGPLYVIPGSHLYGQLNFERFCDTDKLSPSLNPSESKIPLLLKPGDMVMMHQNLVHMSSPNNATCSRRVFINGFSYPFANSKAYPGKGSAKRISLISGQELSPGEQTVQMPLKFIVTASPGINKTQILKKIISIYNARELKCECLDIEEIINKSCPINHPHNIKIISDHINEISQNGKKILINIRDEVLLKYQEVKELFQSKHYIFINLHMPHKTITENLSNGNKKEKQNDDHECSDFADIQLELTGAANETPFEIARRISGTALSSGIEHLIHGQH